MRKTGVSKTALTLLVAGALFTCLLEQLPAQAQTPPSAAAATPATPAPRAQANLSRLMKGTFYPVANVFFAAQDIDPATVPRAKDPNMATDLLTTVFGRWEAIENSAVSLGDLADLLMVPGRKCANGLDVPLKNADWAPLVQTLRDAGAAAFAAAQTKNQDKVIDAAGLMTTACANCHGRYRDRRKFEDRCK